MLFKRAIPGRLEDPTTTARSARFPFAGRLIEFITYLPDDASGLTNLRHLLMLGLGVLEFRP